MQQFNTIEVKDIIKAAWRGKYIIFLSVVICSASALFWSLSLPNIYEAELTIVADEAQGEGSNMSQLGSLASLAGINVGSSSSKSQLALEVLKTRTFLSDFISMYGLKEVLMAVNDWDPISGELVYNLALYDPIKKKWLRPPNGLKKSIPSDFEVAEFFLKNNLQVLTDDSGITTKIYVSHYSPIVATEIANTLVKYLNETMKKRVIKDSVAAIEYIEKELGKTNNIAMKNTLYSIMEGQLKTKMLANSKESYVFKIIDKAYQPEMKSSPRRAIICILAFLASFLLSTIAMVTFNLFQTTD